MLTPSHQKMGSAPQVLGILKAGIAAHARWLGAHTPRPLRITLWTILHRRTSCVPEDLSLATLHQPLNATGLLLTNLLKIELGAQKTNQFFNSLTGKSQWLLRALQHPAAGCPESPEGARKEGQLPAFRQMSFAGPSGPNTRASTSTYLKLLNYSKYTVKHIKVILKLGRGQKCDEFCCEESLGLLS